MNYHLETGDTLELLRAMKSESVDFICTSPPYPGVSSMWGDFFSPENFEESHAWLDMVWGECARVLKSGCKMAINVANIGRNPYLANHARLYQWAWHCPLVEPKADIIWHKQETVRANTAWGSYRNPTDMHFCDGHEYISVFRKVGKREAKTTKQVIDKDDFLKWRMSIWKIEPESATRVKHIAPFPVEIPRRLITLYTFEGETVLDPFSGMASTGVACVKLNRDYIGFEHNPEYVAASIERLNESQFSIGQSNKTINQNMELVTMF